MKGGITDALLGAQCLRPGMKGLATIRARHGRGSLYLLSFLSAAVFASCQPTPQPTADASSSGVEPPAVESATPVPSAKSTSRPADLGLDVCALLDSAGIEQAIGPGFGSTPMPSSGWVAGQCAWNGPSAGFFVSIGTAASIEDSGNADLPDAKAKFLDFLEQAQGDELTTIPGLGDGAAREVGGAAAYVGDSYVQITNMGLTQDELTTVLALAIGQL
jgi:hypothetical protein